MNKSNLIVILVIITALFFCNDLEAQNKEQLEKPKNDKIKILNFGTFHMGFTPDANTVEYDEHSDKNKKEVHEIAKKLSRFEPTVIIVETVPTYNNTLRKAYLDYLDNPNMTFKHPSEIELLAFELGRLCQVDKIYGIDHKMEYDYSKIGEMAKELKEETYLTFMGNMDAFNGLEYNQANTLGKLRIGNSDEYLDWLIVGNADIMTHVSTEKGFEGADEAAKYYQRNLRMYSNLNKLPLSKDDRVFILMGTSHTAFFRDFMSRSPKYEMVNTLDYLK